MTLPDVERAACIRCRFFSRTTTGAASIRGDCVKPLATPGGITNAVANYVKELTNIDGNGGGSCATFETGTIEQVRANSKLTRYRKKVKRGKYK